MLRPSPDRDWNRRTGLIDEQLLARFMFLPQAPHRASSASVDTGSRIGCSHSRRDSPAGTPPTAAAASGAYGVGVLRGAGKIRRGAFPAFVRAPAGSPNQGLLKRRSSQPSGSGQRPAAFRAFHIARTPCPGQSFNCGRSAAAPAPARSGAGVLLCAFAWTTSHQPCTGLFKPLKTKARNTMRRETIGCSRVARRIRSSWRNENGAVSFTVFGEQLELSLPVSLDSVGKSSFVGVRGHNTFYCCASYDLVAADGRILGISGIFGFCIGVNSALIAP